MAKTRKRTAPALARAKGIVVSIPDDLRKAHPVVKRTLSGCRTLRADHNNLLRYEGQPGIELRLSRKQLRRAMRIADGFISAVEARGHRVMLSDTEPGAVELHVNGAVLGFSMSESLHDVPTTLDRDGNQQFRSVPSGSLSLRLFSNPWYLTHGRTHRDGRTFPLESRIALAIPDVERIAAYAFTHQEAERQEERQWQAELRRTEMADRVLQRRALLSETLERVVNRVALLDSAQEFLERLEREKHASSHTLELATWLRFAISRLGSARRLNLLVPEEVRKLARTNN